HGLRELRQRPAPAPWNDIMLREIASLLRCDLTLIISEFEVDWLRNNTPVDDVLLHYLPFLLDPVEPAWPGFEQREHFITIGNFRHPPNWDAIRYMKETLWPLIRTSCPEAELHVYGAYPPPKATQLDHPATGFRVRGWADDVDEVMRRHRVCLAPLRFGAGLKGKLADAMRNGTPNVTTGIGAEGMAGNLPWSGHIENEPEAFACAAVELYRDGEAWHEAQNNGLEIVNQRFDRASHGEALIQRLTDLPQNRPVHFLGALLRHHTLKSSMYMARWIEAKNR
ncbi:MAG: glycosyltransferase family 4 protein, partial [Verrucomicrobiota bacterium]